MIHVDLFSGIGGFALAAEWTGFKTIVFCEKNEFCQKVLQKRFGGFIADSKRSGKLQQKGGKQTQRKRTGDIPIIPEIRDFDGTKWRGATLLTGGFPCQPFSCAGQQRGKEDDRYLWPEMFRIIEETKPRWIIAENVTGIIKMALGQVLSDLESIGYDFPRDHEGTPIVPIIPACGLNAPHRRYRVWIVAYCDESRLEGKQSGSRKGLGGRYKLCNSHASGSTESRLPKSQKNQLGKPLLYAQRDDWQENWYEVAARFCRVDDGVPDRVHRLKALGNAIIPQIAEVIMRGIKQIEMENK